MNLPHADNLVFRVMGARDRFGHFRGRIKTKPELNEIGVSIQVVKSTDLLMATMAHEMIHLYQHENGSCTRGLPQYGIRAHRRAGLPHPRLRPGKFLASADAGASLSDFSGIVLRLCAKPFRRIRNAASRKACGDSPLWSILSPHSPSL